MKIVKHYVEFCYPGLLFADTSCEEIGHRDPLRIDLDGMRGRYGGAYAFRFFDKEFVGATDDNGARFERLVAERTNESKLYYPGATVLSRREVDILASEEPNDRRLALASQNMARDGVDRAIRTRVGNLQAYSPDKMVIL